MKRTPLYDNHIKAGGRMVDFHGWELPVQYTGIIEEHECVRTAAGLFDVSHMGELDVSGPDAGEFVQGMITNDISNTMDGQIVYSPLCYPDGGTVDDLIVYKYGRDHYLLVVNASNTRKDFEWLLENRKGAVNITDVSEEFAQLALQGPSSQAVLQKLVKQGLDGLGFFRFRRDMDVGGVVALVSRSGYTGEDGFEIYVSPSHAGKLWDLLLEAGREYGLAPAGLGARDTLRLEAALPLYGHELSEDISPLEAGLGRFVRPDKGDFTGRQALVEQLAKGLKRRLTGFEMLDRGVPRSGYEVRLLDRTIGTVTSGGFAPALKKNIGMALIDTGLPTGGQLDVIVREKALKASIVKLPFYKKKYNKGGIL